MQEVRLEVLHEHHDANGQRWLTLSVPDHLAQQMSDQIVGGWSVESQDPEKGVTYENGRWSDDWDRQIWESSRVPGGY